jgi:aminoglycoside phosphotransferase (APT) family kinase protein
MTEMTLPLGITQFTLRQILAAHGLGEVQSIAPLRRGSINPGALVNDAHIIRFDTRSGDSPSRFAGEADAYRRLADTGVPVPAVIALDFSREIAPHPYLITTKRPGLPLVERWPDLSAAARAQTARQAGRLLAMIHKQEIGAKFGALSLLAQGGGSSLWLSYVSDYVRRYAKQAVELGLVDPFLPIRAQTVLLRHRSTLTAVTSGQLVHSDYHLETILVEGETISGVIDFEWALSGDPSWDFVVEDQWEAMCPGSRTLIYEGYQEESTLPDDHAVRVMLYRLLAHVESVVDFTRRGDPARATREQERLFDVLQSLES